MNLMIAVIKRALRKKLAVERGRATWRKDRPGFKAWPCRASRVTLGNLLGVPEFQSCHEQIRHNIPFVPNLRPQPCYEAQLSWTPREGRSSLSSVPSLPALLGATLCSGASQDLDSWAWSPQHMLPPSQRPQARGVSLSHLVSVSPHYREYGELQ